VLLPRKHNDTTVWSLQDGNDIYYRQKNVSIRRYRPIRWRRFTRLVHYGRQPYANTRSNKNDCHSWNLKRPTQANESAPEGGASHPYPSHVKSGEQPPFLFLYFNPSLVSLKALFIPFAPPFLPLFPHFKPLPLFVALDIGVLWAPIAQSGTEPPTVTEFCAPSKNVKISQFWAPWMAYSATHILIGPQARKRGTLLSQPTSPRRWQAPVVSIATSANLAQDPSLCETTGDACRVMSHVTRVINTHQQQNHRIAESPRLVKEPSAARCFGGGQ